MPIFFGSNFAKEPFQFDSVGNDWEQENVNRPDGFPLYHYLQTQEGVGIVTVCNRDISGSVKNTTIELNKGEGILLSPHVAHSYCSKYMTSSGHTASLNLPWKTRFATFTGALEPAFKTIFSENSYVLINEDKGNALSDAIDKAVSHFKTSANDTRTLSLDCYNIMLLLSDQTNYAHVKNNPVFEKYVKPVIDHVESRYMEDISAKELADSVFVSQQYLSRIFSEFMNCSVYEYLTNYRINKAKELLLINNKRKIQDIACDVGYSDSSHFIVMFKKMTGMTPVNFRKLHT